mmetsp:Transcript_32829/g.103933  ORF Transcript_32829/g.103933 Transcript_32829/m.103933 type:complete len:541 (-) Transcript_32829:1783-3405(-)
MKLFQEPRRKSRKRPSPGAAAGGPRAKASKAGAGAKPNPGASPSPGRTPQANPDANHSAGTDVRTFAELGLCEWVTRATRAMGYGRPTPVQAACIPSVLAGQDVVGCAETGSGKTAAFALPLLHKLSEEPYGVFAVVLTPTRELALQISDQFSAFGANLGLRLATVIGGVDMVAQQLELATRPHVIVATPGRLADHLRGASPPFLRRAQALVLDEADRLLTGNYTDDVRAIAAAMPPPAQRQTLLFSATMDDTIGNVAEELLGVAEAATFDCTTPASRMPAQLVQQYAFLPDQLKLPYLVHMLNELTAEGVRLREEGPDGDGDAASAALAVAAARKAAKAAVGGEEDDEEDTRTSAGLPLAQSAIIFVNTCKAAAEVNEALAQLKVPCVALHSTVGQKRRLAALGTFKSHQVKLLVATDVASRGLDIPSVDLVVHYDLPRDPADYVHRCGRTARAGRWGRSVAMVTQFDVSLVHAIEERTEKPMEQCAELDEDEALKLLNSVSKALRTARVQLEETGFNERHDRIKERNKRYRAEAKRNK